MAFSNSNPVLKQSKSHALAGLSANPISAWKPSLTQSLARRWEDPPSVWPSLPLSRWPNGHLGFLAAPETARSVSPSIPHPAVPQRPEPRRPGGGGRPTPPGDPASFGKSDSEDLGAPSHHRTRVLLARRAHLICPWQARRAAPLPLRCAALRSLLARPKAVQSRGGRAATAPPPAPPGPRLIRQQQLLAELPGAIPPTAWRRHRAPAPRAPPENFARLGPLRALQVRTGALAAGPELPLSGPRMGVQTEARASYTVLGRGSETDTLRGPQGSLRVTNPRDQGLVLSLERLDPHKPRRPWAPVCVSSSPQHTPFGAGLGWSWALPNTALPMLQSN